MSPDFVMNQENNAFTTGPILRAVWRLGWPAVTSMFMETFLTLTNAFWVGKLGATEMAAVTSSLFPIWTIFATLNIISTGVLAITSRAVGAGDGDEVSRTGRQGLIFAIIVGLVYSLLGFLLTPAIFSLMGTEPLVTSLGISYLRILFAGCLLFALSATFGGIFRAVGDTRAAMMASVTAVVVNIILDPLMIFGIGPFPRWGTDGAAIATNGAANDQQPVQPELESGPAPEAQSPNEAPARKECL